ncbi:MAG: hypothetical protein FJ276_25215, partial [Planctomycetes bacterium]|nr:hypothetical protein [Planctomycetota bacterium]
MTKNLLMAKLLLVMSWCLASGAETRIADATHVVVRKPPESRGFTAPNNGGIWSWGNEILVMYVNGPHKNG